MYKIHKLKPDRNFYMLLLPAGSILAAAFFGLLFGMSAFFRFFTAFFWIYAVYALLAVVRTRNFYFLVQAFYMVSVGLAALFAPEFIRDRPAFSGLIRFLISLVIFSLVWLVLVFANRKLKWRGREILELAAAPVEVIGNGYTARPLPAGKTDFTPRQIMEFAEFARRNLIAVSYVGKDKIVFVPIRDGREFPFIVGLKSDYSQETWVAFDYDGKVSVNISHRDYLEYREALAFVQLCESLGNLFVEFIEMHQRGEGVRIIDRLNAVGVSVFA